MGAFAQEERTRRVGRGGSGRGGAGEGGGWFSLQATIVADLMHCSQMLVRPSVCLWLFACCCLWHTCRLA